jgi:hypothetical protein
MRLGEQVDIFLKSNAYAKLKDLPAMKMAMQHLAHEMQEGKGPAPLIQFFHAPENKDLTALIHDLWRQEIFVYGGEDFTRFLKLASQMNGTMRIDRMLRQMQTGMRGGNQNEAQVRGLLDAIKSSNDVVFPDVVFGFKLSKTEPAKTQLARLEGLVKHVLEEHHPEFKDRLKPYSQSGAQGFTVEADGSLVPWDKLDIEQFEEEKGEYQAVIEKLKSLKLNLTFAVKGDYLLISLGSGTQQLAKFGTGPALYSREEFAPLKKAGDKKITAVSYTSRKMLAEVMTTPEDVKEIVKGLKKELEGADISKELREKIERDVDNASKDLASQLPKPGAKMGFEFLTPTGVEGFNYNYAPADAATKQLTILDQVGGHPLVMTAGRGHDMTPSYRTMVKWLKVFFEHAMAVAEEKFPGAGEMAKNPMEQALPFLKRFDEITGTMMLPALADGQSAFVLDAKWQSSKWFPELDQHETALPLLEIGLVMGVSDADLLIKGLKSYRQLINDILELGRNLSDKIPESGVPAAETKQLHSGTMYFWPVPDMGQDKQIQPNFAISRDFIVGSLSEGHSERILKTTSSGNELRRLADGKPISSAAMVDFAGIVSAARPWIEKFALPQALEQAPEDKMPPGMKKADIPPQVATIFNALSCLKRFASVTYREGDATVTHHEMIVEDMK